MYLSAGIEVVDIFIGHHLFLKELTTSMAPPDSCTLFHSATIIQVPVNSTCCCWLTNVLICCKTLDSVWTSYETWLSRFLTSLLAQNGATINLLPEFGNGIGSMKEVSSLKEKKPSTDTYKNESKQITQASEEYCTE